MSLAPPLRLPNVPESLLIARAFAAGAHGAQTYGGREFLAHLDDVASLLHRVGGRETIIAAAYLQETLKRTTCTRAYLSSKFGPDVADLVYAVGAPPWEQRSSPLALLEDNPDVVLLTLATRVAIMQSCLLRNDLVTLERYRSDAGQYRALFKASGSPLYLFFEALALRPLEGLCVCVLAERDGKFLSTQRRRRPEYIGLMGGKLEPGEEPLLGAVREFGEESGYTVRLQDLRLAHVGPDETDVLTATFWTRALAEWPDSSVGPEKTLLTFESPARLTCPTVTEFSQYNVELFEALALLRQAGLLG